jgi:hypothetical protein
MSCSPPRAVVQLWGRASPNDREAGSTGSAADLVGATPTVHTRHIVDDVRVPFVADGRGGLDYIAEARRQASISEGK